MSLKLAQITAPRTTLVKIYETDETGKQIELTLNIRHKRLTLEVGRKIDEIIASIGEEPGDSEKKPGGKAKTAQPRNVVIEQLVFLVEHTDIIGDNGKVMPPTRETFEQLPGNLLYAMMEGISGSIIPEKKSSTT